MGMWLFGVATVEASTLGWVQMITQIANEVRNLGLVCLGLAIVLGGIRILFRQRLDDIGETLSSYSVGGAFIGTGLTVPALLLGFAAGADLTPVTPDLADSFSTVLSYWLVQGPIIGVGVALWRHVRHG
jgi:hypothetical protein